MFVDFHSQFVFRICDTSFYLMYEIFCLENTYESKKCSYIRPSPCVNWGDMTAQSKCQVGCKPSLLQLPVLFSLPLTREIPPPLLLLHKHKRRIDCRYKLDFQRHHKSPLPLINPNFDMRSRASQLAKQLSSRWTTSRCGIKHCGFRHVGGIRQ